MTSEGEFRTLVAQAYEHLYDLVYLRCHPLADLLIHEPALERKERAWALHHVLLRALDDLDPGPNAPPTSIEARRHQLMVLRYADGLDPQTTSDQLGISRRHFYREHEAALEAASTVLWQQYLDSTKGPPQVDAAQPQADRTQLLRQEAERLAQADHFSRLHEVLPGVLSLLSDRLCQRNLTLTVSTPPSVPPIGADRNLLRQLLLASLSFLAERSTDADLTLAASTDAAGVTLQLSATPKNLREGDRKTQTTSEAVSNAWGGALAPVQELASLGQATVTLLGEAGIIEGLELHLPAAPERTVLVVDDNPDALEFFRRVLPYHGYYVVSAATGTEALNQARALHPDIVILDVMIPEHDGWEVLQILRNQPETQGIPVVICSVLRAGELALSMGATAFLAKPLTEDRLLAVLQGPAISGNYPDQPQP